MFTKHRENSGVKTLDLFKIYESALTVETTYMKRMQCT